MSEATAFILSWLLCAAGSIALLAGALGFYVHLTLGAEQRERDALKRWRKDNAAGEGRCIPRTLDPIVGSSSEGTE